MLKSENFLSILILFSLTLTGFSDVEAQVVEGNTYHNKAVGLSFTKPDEWHFLSFDEILKEKGTTLIEESKEDAAKRKQYLKSLTASTGMEPVAVARYKEPYKGLNPQFQVFFRPGYEENEDSALSRINEYLYYTSQHIVRFRAIIPSKLVKVSGREAAYSMFYFTYTTNEGENIKTIALILLIPKGDKYFLISTISSADEWPSLKGQFEKIIDSINVEY
jgi:hypothetical protein